MITLTHQEHPELSILHVCDLHGISRSWYYEQSHPCEQNAQDTALRDQIERLILEFSFINMNTGRIAKVLSQR